MSHPRQKLIDNILGNEQEERDHSLQSHALERATSGKVPTTLTPWEWEQWYADHGVPESHKRSEQVGGRPAKLPWWKRLLQRLIR